MPVRKSAKKRMLEAVKKANDEGNTFLANEITANVMVGTTMVIVFAVMILCLILNELNVFTADKALMRWAVLAAAVVEIPITVINSIYVGNSKGLKIPLMVDLTLVCAILAGALGHNVTLVMLFPVIVSTRYFDSKYTMWVAIFTAVVFLASTIFSAFYGILNLNAIKISEGLIVEEGQTLRDAIVNSGIDRGKYLGQLLVNDFMPRLIVFLALSVSCWYVASRGKKMIDTQSDNVKKTARIETELDLATKIQTSMLPCIFPAFPEHENIQLRAEYFPAKEVGGDFYDYFKIDEKRIGLVIADVSGKGVGAALFMTISKTVLKNQLQLGIEPVEAIKNANRQLCENNDAGLFVTCWAGVYNVDTGILSFVNAGHNPPVLLKKGGKPSFIKQHRGFVLAGMENFNYKQDEIKLDVGDEIMFYTDGVTEATNPENELYGEDRLLDCLELNCEKDITEQLKLLKADIDKFDDGAPQFDDITVMAIKIS